MKIIRLALLLILLISTNLMASEYSIPLDAHYHYNLTTDQIDGNIAEECNPSHCEPDLTYKDFLASREVKTALLISDSYNFDKNNFDDKENGEEDIHPLYRYTNKESLIPIVDKRVSQITQDYPDRFIGICGLNYGWEIKDAIKRVQYCLSLPGMKGIKLHSYPSKDQIFLKEKKAKSLIVNSFESIKEKSPIILWHIFHNNNLHCEKDSPSNCGREEIDFLFKMANQYKNFTFIIAHSMYSVKAIDYLINLEKEQGKRKNIYLETSEANSNESLGKAWVRFGLDRILYGSDTFHWSRADFHNKSGLNKAQIKQIEQTNGKVFLEKFKS